MNTTQASTKSPEFIAALCHELVVLAKRQEDVAATEAARVPYWSPAHRVSTATGPQPRLCGPTLPGWSTSCADGPRRADLAPSRPWRETDSTAA